MYSKKCYENKVFLKYKNFTWQSPCTTLKALNNFQPPMNAAVGVSPASIADTILAAKRSNFGLKYCPS